jgi:hypothetical protein
VKEKVQELKRNGKTWELLQETYSTKCFEVGKIFLTNIFQFLLGFWFVIEKPSILGIIVYVDFCNRMIIGLFTIVVWLWECMEMIWIGRIRKTLKS